MSDVWRQAAYEPVKQEAERRVRAGESRAEVARLLGVPLSTMAQWAQAGRWRRKDIEREQSQALAEAAAQRIASAHALALGDRVRLAEMEERLAAAALEDEKAVRTAMKRLDMARALLAEARQARLAAINAAYGYGDGAADAPAPGVEAEAGAGRRLAQLPEAEEDG